MEYDSLNDANFGSKKWYEEFPKGEAPYKHSKSEVEVLDLKSEAKKYLENEVASFQLKQSKSNSSELTWFKTALTRGTSADKVAASIVLIQNSPKHNLARLTSLISQIRVSKHNQSVTVITALRDLFLSDLLHPRYKLLKFEEQDLNEVNNLSASNKSNKYSSDAFRKKLLAHWYFEDQLKEQYERFVVSLSSIASDTVDTNRQKAVSVMTELLMTNAEQGQKLLELLINKIGDPNSKVASKTVFCLIKLLNEQPYMKFVVLQEVEKLLFRKNLAHRAQYYAICLLTQFVLGREDRETATRLIDIYFAFFKACLKRGEPDSRMMAAILTGVNRAYLFANTDTDKVREHIDSVYKVVHIGSFNVALNALNLLYQVVSKDPAQSNRFYSAFYRKLMDPQLGTANRRTVFLNLLFRVLRNDKNTLRSYAIIKRILQVILYFPASMICATLYVVSKVLHIRTDIKHLITCIETNFEIKSENDLNETAVSSEVNLENETDDVVSEIKTQSQDDGIFLPNVRIEPIKEDTIYKDLMEEYKTENVKARNYDPFGRNPLSAGAHRSFYVELTALSRHFHPSVALFASMILQGKPIIYTGDPLEDLLLIRFLDRYVFKNPKRLDSKRIVRKNDPLAQRAAYAPKGVRSIPVGSAAYLNEREERIPVDELFLYRYLKNKQLRGQYERKHDEEDNESVNSEEFNDMLDKFSKDKDFNLDIAADIEITKSKKKGAFAKTNDDDNDGDEFSDDESMNDEIEENDIIDDDDDDEELMEMNDDDMEGISDEDLSVMDFDGDDFDDIENGASSGSIKHKNKVTNKKVGKTAAFEPRKKRGKGLDSVFVSAEEFAEMLEEQGRSKYKQGGTNVMSDVDGASTKQLDWELKRNQRFGGTRGGKRRKNIDRVNNNKNMKKFKR